MDSILSVGIDIGTTTTSMIASRISFANNAVGYMVPQIGVADKQILYKSQIYRTPVLNENHLDGEKIKDIISREYEKAGLVPENVDSGAVIITGESLLKDNADIIVEKLSDYAGEFVVATAGPDLESVIAGKGSGIQEYSRENNCTAVNIDMGGGTSNIAVFSCGELIGSTCLDIGGRMIEYDDKGIITYVSPKADKLTARFGFRLIPGRMRVTSERLAKMADIMTTALFRIFEPENNSLAELVLTTGSKMLTDIPVIESISLSGGVADCYFGGERDIYKYNDMGVALAQSIAKSRFMKDMNIVHPAETIRATVVGAGVHTMTVSGSTITYSDGIFPIKNIPVCIIDAESEEQALEGNPGALIKDILKGIEQTGSEKMVLCLKGKKKIAYSELCNIAEALACCSDTVFKESFPLMIMTENDMAKSLGQAIERFKKENRDIVCIDKLKVNNGDYIDIGRPIMNGITLPVVVKTLIFK